MLHRPHGMGKSLLVSSLKHLFSKGTVGTEDFTDHNHWQEPNCYFVFHFSWTDISAFSRDSFERGLYAQLIPYAELFGLTLDEDFNTWVNFKNLVKESEKKLSDASFLALHPELTDGNRPLCNKIVVLVDDYDAPLNKNLQKPDVFKEIKEAVCLFFSAFKSISMRFVLLTGVTEEALLFVIFLAVLISFTISHLIAGLRYKLLDILSRRNRALFEKTTDQACSKSP